MTPTPHDARDPRDGPAMPFPPNYHELVCSMPIDQPEPLPTKICGRKPITAIYHVPELPPLPRCRIHDSDPTQAFAVYRHYGREAIE